MLYYGFHGEANDRICKGADIMKIQIIGCDDKLKNAIAAKIKKEIGIAIETSAPVKQTKITARQLSEKTQDAYSANRYGAQWVNCAALLLECKFTAEEAEEILRSKFMRWSADGASAQSKSAYFISFAAALAGNFPRMREDWVGK